MKREDWEKYESRIERNTHRLLDLLDKCKPVSKTIRNPEVRGQPSEGSKPSIHNSELITHNSSKHHSEFEIRNSDEVSSNSKFVTRNSSDATEHSQRATFFCLGWVAERYPHLIKEIHSRGHEIASHGYEHHVITAMSPEEFCDDIRRSKAFLEDLIGQKVFGHRAPSFSITQKTLWALEILAEEGFLYDSSIFPIHHDLYGIPNAPRHPFIIDFSDGDIPSQFKNPKYLTPLPSTLNPTRCPLDAIRSTSPSPYTFRLMHKNSLIEFPLSTFKFFGQNIPVSGGGYFRAFPLRFTRWVLRRIQKEDSLPFILYIHPWEIDPGQPRLNGISYKSRFRHYMNLDKTEDRLIRLLQESALSSFRDFINSHVVNLNKIMGAKHNYPF